MYKIFRGLTIFELWLEREEKEKREIFLLIFNKIKYNFISSYLYLFFYSNIMKFFYIERKEVRFRLEKHKWKWLDGQVLVWLVEKDARILSLGFYWQPWLLFFKLSSYIYILSWWERLLASFEINTQKR